jgi:hypothetical protein
MLSRCSCVPSICKVAEWASRSVVLLNQPRIVACTISRLRVCCCTLLLQVRYRRESFAPRSSWIDAKRDNFAGWTAGGAPVKDESVAEMIEAGMQAYAPITWRTRRPAGALHRRGTEWAGSS